MKSTVAKALILVGLLMAGFGPLVHAQGPRFFNQPIGKDGVSNASITNPIPIEVEQVAGVQAVTVGSTQTTAAVASLFKAAINANNTLKANYGISSADASSNVLTITYSTLGAGLQFKSSGSTTATIATAPAATTGLYTATVTFSTSPTTADVETLTFTPSASSSVTLLQSAAAISASNPLYVQTTNGTTANDATHGLYANLLQGNAVLSATKGIFSNILQGDAVLSATNGLYSNLLQGNAVLSLSNALPVMQANSTKATYTTVVAPFTPVATPTDIFILPGSATKTVKVLKVTLTSVQGTTGLNEWLLLKRSTANSGGTSSATTIIPVDSNSSAATAAPLKYTGNPTTGTSLGSVVDTYVVSPKTDSTASARTVLYDASTQAQGEPITLRGVAEGLALNFAGAAVPASMAVGLEVTFSEE